MSKILIVDDNVNICYMLKSFLEEADYDVTVSHSGMDALEKVKTLKPDIMLLDMIMAGMGGMEVLKCIRQFDKHIVVIIISALIDEAYCKKALENGADEYITKPFDFKYLNERIHADLLMRNNEST